jgi:iron complex transport system substrate-binding protein
VARPGSPLQRTLCAAALAALALSTGAPRAAADPVRVATLVPYVEDALGRMPASKVVVIATVRRSLHEPARAGVADLGSPHAPSLEGLAAARPSLIVGDASLHASLAENAKQVGAELVLLDSASIDATFAGLGVLASRVGVAPEMGREVERARADLAKLALDEPIATLALFGTSARWLVVTERSWLGDLLGRLQLASVAKGARGAERIPGYAEISDEQIATTRPALVLVVAHGDPNAIRVGLDEKIGPGGAWSGIAQSAVDGVHVLDPALFTANPGLALPDAARRLIALAATPPAFGARQ